MLVTLPFKTLNSLESYNTLIEVFSIDTLFDYGCLLYGVSASWPYVDHRTVDRIYIDIYEELYDCAYDVEVEDYTAVVDYFLSQFILFGEALGYLFERTGRVSFNYCGQSLDLVYFEITSL